MPSRLRVRHTTYLVALTAARSSATPVYAARMPGAAEALAAVMARAGETGQPVIVGSLSTRTAKAMNLKPGEVRQV
ncbi:hypothetical protein [Methylobacterium sp. J-076]|uniref:hypothetical protein n=1 Tax=Methylobacterium sp. J-076 TaxID=2836655 RepID=UPI001FBB8204|nr:hypothetical protein [Methylobacterium sp. J-076]MCJ2012844.1 hypothetical protein [Methylobacterium sp. J-076]